MSLDEALRLARARWPALAVTAEQLAGVLREGVPAGAEAHAADLVLACACACGDAAAQAELDRLLGQSLPRGARKGDPEGGQPNADELLQQVRTKLLVGVAGGPPKILDYGARGPLEHWLRAALARTAANLAGARRWEAPLDDQLLAALPADQLEPELKLARERHAAAFKDAFRAALAALSDRDRAVLRMYVLEGLNVQEIGAVYRVDRSTVVRWVVRIRRALLDETYQELGRVLGATRSETESLVRALGSQLEASFGALVAGPGDDAGA